MTSEPDSTPRRRPPTIDLTATEVEAERQASTEKASAEKAAAAEPAGEGTAQADAPPLRASRNSSGRFKALAGGAVVGALLVAAVIAGLWAAGFVPPRVTAGPPAAPAAKTAATDEISSRLDKIQQALQAQQPDQALATRLAAAEAQTKSLGDSLAAINRRLDETAAASQSALTQAKTAGAAADGAKSAAQTGIQRGDLEALGNRVAALEGTVKTLSDDVTRRASAPGDRAARLTVATEALRAAAERGAPYEAELAAAKSLGADQNAVAALEPFAAAGVPSAAALAQELTMLTPALRQASGAPGPSDNSFVARIESNAQKLVRVTPIDAPTGDDPASVIARISADAARGDIAGALADIARLPPNVRALAVPWVQKADARNAALAASRRIAAAALAALDKPASQ